ncbi:acetate--CoA ligase family protein [Coralliovum pocilloporae]|uniref:acetate--CoA ligase family protein n=1 Tax=Coralliovum pocilloporae TaxID=3066369 RepID=UPI003307AE07
MLMAARSFREGLGRLLRPRSIAFFGGNEAAEAIRQCKRMGYRGQIWPVHPKKTLVEGYPCFASVADLPSAPDAAFLGVNRYLTIDLVRQLSEAGAGGAVCYASGFKEAVGEVDDGADLQEQLIEAAGPMAILGPNCYGCINYMDGALLWPDQHGGAAVETGVAILTQSSNIAINLTMQARGLPVAYVLTAGNQAQCGLSELASAALDDPRVTVLGLHIEGIDDIAAFEATVLKAREKNIPVVVLKIGRSEAAQALTISHTASLAGSDSLTNAFLRRLGAARVYSLPSFLETLKLLHVLGPLDGTSITSMSCSGGEASLMADSAEGRAVFFRALAEDERGRVKDTLNEIVAVANPLDYHTFIWGDQEKLTATFTAMLSNGFDLSILVLDFPRTDRCGDEAWQAAVNALAEASHVTGAKAAVLATLQENLSEDRAAELCRLGLVPMVGIDDAYDAIEAAAEIGAAFRRQPGESLRCIGAGGVDDIATIVSLDEDAAKAVLSGYGLPVPDRQLVTSEDDAVNAACALGLPVVLKVVSDTLAHKSDVGGVAVGLQTDDEVRAAYNSMAHLSDRFMVEAMVTGTVAEILVGINRDEQFGLHLVLGAGGVLVDLLKDSATLLLPTTREEIIEALLSLKTAALLTGYRGAAPADLEAAADLVLAVVHYAMEEGDGLLELDVNPVMLRPKGEGAVAVDAVIRRIQT